MNREFSADDEARMETLARAQGLERVLTEFRDDLRTGFLSAEQLRRGLAGNLTPQDEPWPPMCVSEKE